MRTVREIFRISIFHPSSFTSFLFIQVQINTLKSIKFFVRTYVNSKTCNSSCTYAGESLWKTSVTSVSVHFVLFCFMLLFCFMPQKYIIVVCQFPYRALSGPKRLYQASRVAKVQRILMPLSLVGLSWASLGLVGLSSCQARFSFVAERGLVLAR